MLKRLVQYCIIGVLIFFQVSSLQAQVLRSKKDTLLQLTADTTYLNIQLLIPMSIEMKQKSSVLWNDSLNAFIVKDKKLIGENISFSYKQVDFKNLNGKPNYELAKRLDTVYRDTVEWIKAKSENLGKPSNLSQLQRNGLFSRGIRVGSNQDLSVNSNLHLRLDGQISKNLNIRAAVSDYTIPLQPDGTTAQISELDRIYMEVYSDMHSLTAGDFLLRDSSAFLRLHKKWQGINYKGTFGGKKKWKFHQQSAMALSKGVFHRLSFRGFEGNQGPYRLEGKNRESAITILSGSERVYINGDLMKRGANADYTIDYNTSEITFTVNKRILRNSRIIVEYEYVNRQYMRYSFYNQSRWSNKHSALSLRYVGSFDDKLSPLQSSFTDTEAEVLKQAGNNPEKAAVNSAKESDFSVNEILYEKIDSIVAGVNYKGVFRRNYNSQKTSYRVRFTQVDKGKGNYKIHPNSENGRIYKWIAPINGVPQGEYTIKRYLEAAQRQQMLIGHVSTLNNRIRAEFALSEKDLNTFSSLDDKKNLGYGTRIELGDSLALADSSDFMKYRAIYEFNNAQFQAFERYQEVELERNWGLPDNSSESPSLFAGHIATAQFDLKKGDGELLFKPAYLKSDTGKTEAFRTNLNYNLKSNKWRVKLENNLAKNQADSQSGFFVKTTNRFERLYKHWKWGGYLKYRRRQEDGDSIKNAGFQFVEYYVMIGLLGTKHSHLSLQAGQRYDFIPIGHQFKLDEKADDIALSCLWNFPRNKVQVKASLRRIDKKVKDEQFKLNTRFQYDWTWWKTWVRGGIFYESNIGHEPGREYQFVKVSKGQGAFKWIDYNENGIQELDEFEKAVFQDEGEFVKVWYPSQGYIEVRQNRINANLNIRPRFKKNKGIRKFLSQSNIRLTYRNTTKFVSLPWYEFYTLPLVIDSLLSANGRLSARYTWRNRKYGWLTELTYRNKQQVVSLTNGRDLKNGNNYSLRVDKRWKYWQITNTSSYLDEERNSKAFEKQNFNITTEQNKTNIVWKGLRRAKLTCFYRYAKKNAKKDNLNLEIHHTGIGVDWKLPNAMLLQTELAHVYTILNNAANTPVLVNMLDGFLSGHNGLAKVQFNRRFGKFIELNLVYEARFNENVDPIQTGQMQLKAIF